MIIRPQMVDQGLMTGAKSTLDEAIEAMSSDKLIGDADNANATSQSAATRQIRFSGNR